MLQRYIQPFAAWVKTREVFMVVFPAVLAVLLAFVIALQFVTPAPPRTLVMTTGGEAGAYFGFGKRYQQILAQSGVRLEVRPSAGSIENLQRLRSASSGIQAGLLQGGIGNARDAPELISLGRVFHEPLWVFYRGGPIPRLSDLAGKRIAVGPDGSGTRVLALALLGANKITADTATLLPATGAPAVEAMRKGEIDVVFLALAPQAQIIQDLLRASDVHVMSFTQADAYTKLFPYLAKVVLPQGVIDLVQNIPQQDVVLIAPSAALVVREETHPALIQLLAEAAQEVHGNVGLFHRAGEFPTLYDPEFEMSSDAERFYKQGRTFLRRMLPFWLANFVERMAVMLVPLITVMLPLMKIVPGLYKWRIRQRLFHWYRRLKLLEKRVNDPSAVVTTAELRAEIDEIDQSVSMVPAPIEFAEQFYNLRGHVELVRQRVEARVGA